MALWAMAQMCAECRETQTRAALEPFPNTHLHTRYMGWGTALSYALLCAHIGECVVLRVSPSRGPVQTPAHLKKAVDQQLPILLYVSVARVCLQSSDGSHSSARPHRALLASPAGGGAADKCVQSRAAVLLHA